MNEAQAIKQAQKFSLEYGELSVVILKPDGNYWGYLYSDYDGKDGDVVGYYLCGERYDRVPSHY